MPHPPLTSQLGRAVLLAAVIAVATVPSPGAAEEPITGGLQRGGWSHVVPLDLPPAPAGLVPGLALGFDFRSPDGLVGPGWNLAGLSRIDRHGEVGQGVPTWSTGDRFVLDGQLLWAEGAYFHAELDDERYIEPDATTNTWVARRDGWTWTWGGQDPDGNGCAVETTIDGGVYPCENRYVVPAFDETSAWLLSSVEDPWGNRIEYAYASLATIDPNLGRFPGGDTYAHQHVPDEIVYAGGQHGVKLEYNPREDVVIDAAGGVVRVLAGRLEAIQVQSRLTSLPLAAGSRQDGARYELVYADEDASDCTAATERSDWSAETLAGGTGESLLHRVLRVPDGGSGADGGKSLRCTTRDTETGTWPASDAVSLAFEEAGAWVTDRTFTEPAFYSHLVVNFDGGPESELLELRFPVCNVIVETELKGHIARVEQPLPNGQVEVLGTMFGYKVSGCDTIDVESELWSVEVDSATLAPATSSVLDEAMAYLLDADPASAASVLFVDIDRDGQTDVVTARDGWDPDLWRLAPDGRVRVDSIALDWTALPMADPAELLSAAITTDIDGDGLVDLVYDEYWFPNTGSDGYWDGWLPLDLPVTATDYWPLAGMVSLGDVNGDGIADATVAAGERCHPEYPTTCTDPDEGVWLGVGDGTFVAMGDPGLVPLDNGQWVPWSGQTSGGSWGLFFWSSEIAWTWADLDGDGTIEPTDPATSGLPAPLVASNIANPGETYTQILADWDGDGLADALVIESPLMGIDASGDAFLGSSTGTATFYPGSRQLPEGRVTAIQGAWGGNTELGYGRSDDNGNNSGLPWAVDVIASVTGEEGTSAFAFDGGVWWPELGRFMGFRDAVVAREHGGSTHVRFATAPWAGGREVSRSDRRADGSIEAFSYWSPRDASTGSFTLDLAAPLFSPTRERCDAWIGPADSNGNQGVDEADLVAQCECSFDTPMQSPPPNEPPQGPPPQGAPPPQGPPPPPPGSGPGTCTPEEASLLFEAMGWGPALEDYGTTSSGTYYGVWTLEGAPAYTFTGGAGVAAGSWHPAIPAPGRSAYPATTTALPADLYEPGATPPARVGYAVGGPIGTTVVMTAEAWRFDSGTHRLDGHADLGDVDLPGDALYTEYAWQAWDSTEQGARLDNKVTHDGFAAFDAVQESYAYGSAFSEVTSVTQSRSGMKWAVPGSRSWSKTWSGGEVVSETDPDGVTVSYTRNTCGQVYTRSTALRSTESWVYDGTCKKMAWSFLSGSATWLYDAYGRVETVTTDPGGPSSTVLERWSREGNWAAVESGNGVDGVLSLQVIELDEWGREQGTTRCESDGAAVPSCVAGTASRVERGWAADGSSRFVTTPFDPDLASPETLSAAWSYRDELGREEEGWLPAPEVDQAYVSTSTTYLPGSTRHVDPAGVECWDDFDTLSSSRECAGVSRGEQSRDAWGRVLAEMSPDGVATTYAYDAFDRLASATLSATIAFAEGPSQPATQWSWSEAGRPEWRRDHAGVETTWTYDGIGRLDTEVVDGPTMTPVTTRDLVYLEITSGGETVQATAEADLQGNTSWGLADALGRPFSLTLPGGDTTWWAWDSRALLSTRTGIDSVETTMAHDGAGRVVEETLVPLGASRSYAPDAAGRVVSFTDRDGVTTETVYTRSGLPDAVYRLRDAAPEWTLAWWLYEDDGLPFIAAEGEVATAYGYDDLRRVDSLCEGYALGACTRETRYAYDTADRVLGSTVYSGSEVLATAYDWDDAGQLEGVTHPDSTVESWSYYRSGLVAGHEDEAGVASAWGYDDLGRMAWEDLPLEGSRSFTRVDGVYSGSVGVYYSELTVDEPDGGSWLSRHDFAGRPVYAEDPYGVATRWEYDSGRLAHAEHLDPSGATLAHESRGYGRPPGDAERAVRETRSEPADEAGRRA